MISLWCPLSNVLTRIHMYCSDLFPQSSCFLLGQSRSRWVRAFALRRSSVWVGDLAWKGAQQTTFGGARSQSRERILCKRFENWRKDQLFYTQSLHSVCSLVSTDIQSCPKESKRAWSSNLLQLYWLSMIELQIVSWIMNNRRQRRQRRQSLTQPTNTNDTTDTINGSFFSLTSHGPLDRLDWQMPGLPYDSIRVSRASRSSRSLRRNWNSWASRASRATGIVSSFQ